MPWPYMNDGSKSDDYKEPPEKPYTYSEVKDYIQKDIDFTLEMLNTNKKVFPQWASTPKSTLPKSKSSEGITKLLKEIYGGTLSKEEAYAQMYGKPEPEVLIPATQSHQFTMPYPTELFHPQMQQMYMDMKVHGLNIPKDKFSWVQIIEPWHGYTEPEIRELLYKGFQAFADSIINQLKEKNK